MDTDLIIRVVVPFSTLFVGAFINKKLQERLKLISYVGHTFGIRTRLENEQEVTINTHSIVIKNVGKKLCKNIKVTHHVLPSFQVYPDKEYQIIELPNGGKEIHFNKLVPNEQITINYLYFPPLVWNEINRSISSEDGFAKIVPMQLTQQMNKWIIRGSAVVFFIGAITIIYSIAQGIKYIIENIKFS